jgi:hypothetical protein
MKNLAILSFTVVLVHLLLAGYACDKDAHNPSDVGAQEQIGKACANNADCTVVKEDCCGCSQGGKQKAIAKSLVKGFISELDAKCGDMMCIQMISNDPSCKKSAVCRDGQCVME